MNSISKRIILVALGLGVLSFCSEPDTEGPKVSIISPEPGSIVSELVEVRFSAIDDSDIDQITLVINDSVISSVGDPAEKLIWNTIAFEEGEAHDLVVQVRDEFENWGESETVSVTVDQANARPTAVQITDLDYNTDSLTIVWSPSPEADFSRYDVLHGLDSLGLESKGEIFQSDSTTYSLFEFNPMAANYFQVVVYDTLGLNQASTIAVSNIHEAPSAVDVTNVTYDLSSMNITWTKYDSDLDRMARLAKEFELKSVTNESDFSRYELLRSDTETGARNQVAIISDMDSTRYSIEQFDPTIENWFWIRVVDFWGLLSVGTGMTNLPDEPPVAVDVESVDYNLEAMTVSWSPSQDLDFESYTLYQSIEGVGSQVALDTIYDINQNSYDLVAFDPTIFNTFQIKVTDYWGLAIFGQTLENQLELPPVPVSQYPVELRADSYQITWTKSQATDFESYSVYESFSSDMNDRNLLANLDGVRDTLFRIQPLQKGVDLYYQVEVRDHWSLIASSNIEHVNIPITFFKIIRDDQRGLGVSVQNHPDGGYVILGRLGHSLTYLSKLNRQGELEWEANLNTVGYAHAMEITSDGGVVIAGMANTLTNRENAWLVKIDPNGMEEWSENYGGEQDESARSVRETSDGGFILTGIHENDVTDADELILIKTDQTGQELWREYFPGVSNTQGFDAIETAEGDFIAVGLYTTEGYSNIDAWVLKTNSEGVEILNTVISTLYGSRLNSIQPTDDGHFILSGNYFTENNLADAWLVKIDSQGNRVWGRAFGGWSSDDGNHAVQTNDGGYVLTGMKSDGADIQDIWLIKTATDGTLEWSRTYGRSAVDVGFWVEQTPDGGYVFTGVGYQGYENQGFVLFKTDDEGKIFYPGTLWARP